MGARPLPPDSLNGLLEPTLQEHVARTHDDARPWRVQSQIYVAILGGPIALAMIALENCRRLRVPRRERLLVGAACVVATLLAVALPLLLADAGRIVTQISGALAAGPTHLLMRTFDRAYFAFTPEDEEHAYESLWGPGVVAVLVGGVAFILLDAVTG